MAKEFLSLEKNITATVAEGTKIINLSRNDVIHRHVTMFFNYQAGHTLPNKISDIINVFISAGETAIDLSAVPELWYVSGGSVILDIPFPIHGLQLVLNPTGADINVTICGDNK